MGEQEAREEGKWAAQWHQSTAGECTLPLDNPHWQTLLMQDADKRDQLKLLAAAGDEDAAIEAAFLDGYLSMWD